MAIGSFVLFVVGYLAGDHLSRDVAVVSLNTYLSPWMKNDNVVRARSINPSGSKFRGM